jgi:predicted  nucleic acid-binding Zn-ribbon protein
MKNDILYDKINDIDREAIVLKTLKSIEQKLEKEITVSQNMIEWQQGELKRLQFETVEKNNTIAELNTRLAECRSQVEGNRQLINKLINDIDRLQQNIDWYKRTYESRSLFGVIKDKLKHIFSK